MVVPYGDPGPTQRRKNAFDVGEYGMGMCANSLELGCDCLGLIRYFDAHLCDSRGEPLTIKNAICMHEEDYGILWKHTDRRLPDSPEVRRSRRLVVSSISTVENYEYGFFWYLYQDGTIQFEVKLTGILSLGAFQPGETPPYGVLVAPQLYAPNHQHFFNMRLDFDLDGTANTVHQVDVVPDPIDDANPFENAFRRRPRRWRPRSRPAGNLNLETARTWKVVNPDVHNARRRAGRLQAPARRQLVPVRLAERLVAEARPVRQPPRLGHAVPRRGEVRRAATTRTRAAAATACRAGPSRIGRSRTPTWCSGTPSATRTSPGRRTTR